MGGPQAKQTKRPPERVRGNIDRLAIGLSVLLVLLALSNYAARHPYLFQWTWNSFAILSAIMVAANVVLLYVLARRPGNAAMKFWFGLDMAAATLWGFSELMMRVSATPEAAFFWGRFSYIGLAVLPVGFYMFARTYVGQTSYQRDVVTSLCIMLSAGMMIGIMNNDQKFEDMTLTPFAWGFDTPSSPVISIFSAWVGILIVLALARFVVHYRRTAIAAQRAQIRVIVAAVTISLIGTIVTDVVMPRAGIVVLPIGVLINTSVSMAVLYAIRKYDTFSVDFSMVASEILDALGEAVVVTDSRFNVRLANRRTLELTGLTKEATDRLPMQKLLGREVKPHLQRIASTLEHGSTAEISEYALPRRRRAALAVHVAVAKLVVPYPAYMFVLSDITQLKAAFDHEVDGRRKLESANRALEVQQKALAKLLQQDKQLQKELVRQNETIEITVQERTQEANAERARLEASINALNLGFVMTDSHQGIIIANSVARRLLAGGSMEHLSVALLQRGLGPVMDLKSAISQSMATLTPLKYPSVLAAGKVLSIFVAPVIEHSDNRALGAVILIDDITEAKAIERSRDEFFSIASHELRTPLTAIRGNTQMMREYYKDVFSKDKGLQEMLEDIHDSSVRLITIVNDFLDTSRLEQGKITFEFSSFSIGELVDDVLGEITKGGLNPKVRLVNEVGAAIPAVRADRDRLKQVIINLAGNAVKFTDKGVVTVRAGVDRGMVRLDVVDTGKGISKESRHLLFRKFQQASKNILTRDSTRSTGLGLYISKLIMNGMGGHIWLDSSEEGKGSVFSLTVPVAGQKHLQ